MNTQATMIDEPTEEEFDADMIGSLAGLLARYMTSTPEGRAALAYMHSRYSDPSRFTVQWHAD